MKESNLCLPWQEDYWHTLQTQHKINQLPHALLFVGMPGIGKANFAYQFARSLLCESGTESNRPCGQCRHCLLIKAGNHPDYIIIEPEEMGKAIKIDQIRTLIAYADKSAQLSLAKVIIINPADALNINAANALLKTLEEPSANTKIILVTSRLMSLPATIRSRCQIMHFRTPEKELSKRWLSEKGVGDDQLDLLLRLSHGAPLTVLDFIEKEELAFRREIFSAWLLYIQRKVDLIKLSSDWGKQNSLVIIKYLLSWTVDLVQLKQLDSASNIANIDFAENLKLIADQYSVEQLFCFYDELIKTQDILSKKIALNAQLLLEGLLIVC